MTNLIVQLSPNTTGLSDGMQTLLHNPGVYAYAVYFDANGNNPTWLPLVDNGALQSPPSIDVTQFDAQKLFVIIQSTSPGAGNLQTLITKAADISQGNAIANSYRFDSFELTMTGASPSGNLTDVTGYGLPMGVIVRNADITGSNPFGGLISSAGYGISGNTLVNGNGSVTGIGTMSGTTSNYTAGPLVGTLNTVSNGASNPPASVYGANNWSQYVTAIAGSGGASNIIATVSGDFNPGTGSDAFNIAHHYGFYNYEMAYDPNGYGENSSEQGVFVLTPTAGSAVKGTVVISKAQLEASIYGAQGYAQLYNSYNWSTHAGDTLFVPDIVFSNTNPPTTPGLAWPTSQGAEPLPGYTADGFAPVTGSGVYRGQFQVSANNQWGAIFTKLLTSFNNGLIGAQGLSPNPTLAAQQTSSTYINLSNTANQMPLYYFRNTNVVNNNPGYQYSNSWAKTFAEYTNSYGLNYSDELLSQYTQGSPLLNLAGANNIYLTVYGDAQDMSTVAAQNGGANNGNYGGYITPQYSSGYINPANVATSSGQFVMPTSVAASVSFNVSAFLSAGQDNGAVNYMLDDTHSIIKFNIVDSSGTATTVGTMNGVYADQQGSTQLGLWRTWTVSGSSGSFTLTPNDTTSGQTGEFILAGLPSIASTSSADNVFWYQLQVDHYAAAITGQTPIGTPDSSKTFNIYTIANNNTGTIDTASTYAGGPVQIDGGASVQTTTISPTNAQISLYGGNVAALDGAWMAPFKNSSGYYIYGTPTAPVAGTVSGSVFTATITNTQQTQSYQTSTSNPVLNMKATGATTPVAFSWTGTNHNASNNDQNRAILGMPSTSSNGWAANWSNKGIAGDTIRLTIAGGAQPITTTATVGLDGEWTTGNVNLAPGSYTVTSQEYDAANATAWGAVSDPLQLNITSADAPLYYTPDTASGRLDSELYTGPVSTLQYQYVGPINGNTTNDVLGASDFNDFVNLGAGDDAVNGYLGDDVLDGGTNSNFLTGGGGHDTFFIDGRNPGSTTWSTITDFTLTGANSDVVNIWGWTQGTSVIVGVSNSEGAAGYQGATYHFDIDGVGGVDTSLTFTGLTTQQLGNGTYVPGTSGSPSYLSFGTTS
jgi:hypothetical protein